MSSLKNLFVVFSFIIFACAAKVGPQGDALEQDAEIDLEEAGEEGVPFVCTPELCDDKIDCTKDSCDSLSGCIHELIDALCDDGNLCTGQEFCELEKGCVSKNPLVCNDENECTKDSCTPLTGCIYELKCQEKLTAGDNHTCALLPTGGIKCWGWNGSGQLGDGTESSKSTPVDVKDLSSGVDAIAAGSRHTCALLSTGGVKCWGANINGQLGDKTLFAKNTPVDVEGLSSGVGAIAAGGEHTCALLLTGGVKCWGRNVYGQLGDGTLSNTSTPVDVKDLSSGANTIAAGGEHTCALLLTGGVKCWGDDEFGQLGDGFGGVPIGYKSTPVNVKDLSSGVNAIAAGGHHTCAVLSAGGVKCWGWNGFSQLGDGTNFNKDTPVDVTGIKAISSEVNAIAAGFEHTCAVSSTGGVMCWGNNKFGQLGDGTLSNKSTPVDVINLSSGVGAITAGTGHTCSFLSTGGVKCWGRNIHGQLGDGTTEDKSAPVDTLGF